MAVTFNDSIQLNAPKDIDNRKGIVVEGVLTPYTSKSAALLDPKLTLDARYEGLTVYVRDGGNLAEYWFKDGVLDENFVKKSSTPIPDGGENGQVLGRDEDGLLVWINPPQGEKGDTGEKGEQGETGEQGVKGDDGANGAGVPTGGDTGQALVKTSNLDYATQWATLPTQEDMTGVEIRDALNGLTGTNRLPSSSVKDLPVGVPSGGLEGQLLSKATNADYAFEWTDAGSGGSDLGWANVKDFGAVGDGTTDDAVAIQAAADSLGVQGGVLYFPSGNYLSEDSITLDSPITVLGCGGIFPRTYPDAVVLESVSMVTSNSAILDLFIVEANNCKFENIGLFNTVTATAGHGIKLNKSTGFQIVGCSIALFFVNINFIGGQLWAVDRCMFYGAVSIDMQIANTEVGGGDSGDQSISNSWFYGNDGATQLKYLSGGGLKITNTKFNSSELGQAAVAIDAPINIATVDLLVSNCSIENFTDYGIHIHPSVAFNNIVISGNQFAGHNPIYVDGAGQTMVSNNVINGTNDTALVYVIGANCVIGVNSLSNQSATPDVVTDNTNQVVRRTNYYAIPTAATIKFDPNKGVNQFYILTADTNLNDFPYYNWGDIFQLTVKQNATGGWNLVLPSYWRIVGSLNKEPNSITVIKAYRDVVFNDYSVIMDNQTSFVNPMTTVEKDDLPCLREGTLLYDKTLQKMTFWNGTTWETITSI